MKRTFAASAQSFTPRVNLNTTAYLASTVLYADEQCEVDFCSMCVTRRTAFYTSGVSACNIKTLPDDGGSHNQNISEMKRPCNNFY